MVRAVSVGRVEAGVLLLSLLINTVDPDVLFLFAFFLAGLAWAISGF
jgi:hypothetical protein